MDEIKQSKIKEANARFFGMSTGQMVEASGEALANHLFEIVKTRFKARSVFAPDKALIVDVICGLGNNGADGMALARKLDQKLLEAKISARINTYLIGRNQDLRTEEAKEQFSKLKRTNVNLVQDAYAKDIESADILVEALLGTGIKGAIRKRFKDVITKISHPKVFKVAVDAPVPGYKADLILSLITPKQKRAITLDIGLPKEVENFVGPGHIKYLFQPDKDDYKSKTGELLVLGGSRLFHGAPIMAVKGASKFIGGVFFYTHPENRGLAKIMRSQLEEFIYLDNSNLKKYADYANAVLAGPGWEENMENQALLTFLLNKYPEKIFVLDAYAIAMANPKRNPQNKRGFRNCLLTPHRGELRHIFSETKLEGLEGKLKRFCMENGCHLVLKGSTDILFSSKGDVMFNRTGNPGMAKGGTGDIMGGIVAALACKNDPWEALLAGTFLSGLSGDYAKNQFGFNFSATDEIQFLQKAYKWALEY